MMIELENVSKIYKTKKGMPDILAINELSLAIDRGELVGYLGVNGAGKSTTIKLLSGILLPTSGRISVNGLDPFRYRKQTVKNLGVVFGQKSQLIWDLPAIDTFNLFSKIYGIERSVYQRRIAMLIESLNIESFVNQPVRKLSLGQRMCCEIIAALIHNPAILYLDEPTIGLDVLNKERVRKFIKYINAEFNTTIILTTHDLGDVEELCNRVIVVDKGIKIFDGTISSLRSLYGASSVLELKYRSLDFPDKLPDFPELKLERKENKLLIEFDNSRTDTAALLNSILAFNPNIVDISITPTKFEEVLKKLYLRQP